VLNSLGLVWAQEFGGFWVFGWGPQNGTKKLLSKCCQVLTSLFSLGGGIPGGEFRVFHLCNTRWFQVLETKIPQQKNPLVLGI